MKARRELEQPLTLAAQKPVHLQSQCSCKVLVSIYEETKYLLQEL